MEPEQTGEKYDRIAGWWRERHRQSGYGVNQLKLAINWVKNRNTALDVGCGSSGRFAQVLLDEGFQVSGIDISTEMIRMAKKEHPDCDFRVANVVDWQLEKKYDLVCAWDSTFHLPLDLQEPALANMCDALAPDGVLIFTCGGSLEGRDEAGEIKGTFRGEDLEYSTLGVAEFLRLLVVRSLTIRHVEYDQGPTEPHVYIVAQRVIAEGPTKR